MRCLSLLAFPLVLAACTAETPPPQSSGTPLEMPTASRTTILDQAAAERLRSAIGITLQWISWDYRGSISVWDEQGTIHLRGSQDESGGPGRLEIDGEVREIGADYFVFDGRISIVETPDRGRRCEADKLWRFAITQNRPYWRLREFEWCDGLTDYVDIYF